MSNNTSWTGLGCAVLAYLTWGVSPVYFKMLQSVPAFEILMHRMVWSFFFLLLIILAMRRGRALFAALADRSSRRLLLVSTLLVSGNWFLFIWAINSGHILQTSLGYYICPLVNVLLGTMILQERLRPLQMVAVGLAAAGVGFLTIQHGVFPWVALSLAVTFSLYGLIRKTAQVGALEGLTVETMLLSLPAVGYLVYLDGIGTGAVFRSGLRIDLLLAGTAGVTAFPLLMFTIGARRLRLVTIGFLQYIAPSCTFCLAVFVYGEPFGKAQLFTFVMIWLALILFTVDAVRAAYGDSVSSNSTDAR